jgi:hypothetical protein
VKRKFKQLMQPLSPEIPVFAQIQLPPPPQASSTCLDFIMVTGKPISIRFQANAAELFPLIQALAGIQT